MSARIACERCSTELAATAVTYSTSGESLCSPCAATALVTAGDEVATASERSARNSLRIFVAAVVALPALLIATGYGKHVAQVCFVLGGIALLGAYQWGRSILFAGGKVEPHMKQATIILFGSAVVLLSIGFTLSAFISID